MAAAQYIAVISLTAVLFAPAPAVADIGITLPHWYTSNPLRIKLEHPAAQPWSVRWVLDILTGVDLTLTLGNASLSHKVRTEVGAKVPVAHGFNRIKGFGIGLMDAPRRTRIGVRPDAGFFSNRLVVNGFEQAIPWQPDTVDLGGSCTDVLTNEPVECRKSHDYNLTLRALYAGPQLYGAFVVHNSWLELFVLGATALRLAEFRWLNVEAANERHKNGRLAFFRSVTVGGSIGATFPAQHISVRVSVDYEYYLRFRYPVPLEFEGPISYDAAQDIYLRPRVYMDDASISAVSTTLAAGYLF